MLKATITEVTTDKAQYLCGHTVEITIKYQLAQSATLEVGIIKDFDSVKSFELDLSKDDHGKAMVIYQPESSPWQGYGIECRMIVDSHVVSRLSTVFDVVDVAKRCPRYGFVSDFGKTDINNISDINWLKKLHINMVQFYDWMYRHDDLIPPQEDFVDAMGRELSLEAVENKIEACHRYNMQAIGYGAIYAASSAFYEQHQGWAMYDNQQEALSLAKWVYLMDISADGRWAEHITKEFEKAIRLMDFDGIHLDTYGFPKKYYTQKGDQIIDYKDVVNPFIDKVKIAATEAKPDNTMIYNNVNNFPTDIVTNSNVDAMYVEVWPPHTTYRHLYALCRDIRRQCDKPMILAAYIKPFGEEGDYQEKEATLLLASAVIFASGGYHLVMGGYEGLLHDSYYANYSLIEGNRETVSSYYDYITRYGHLLFDPAFQDVTMIYTGGINEDCVFTNCETSNEPQAGKIWTVMKENDEAIMIHLVNLTSLEHDEWNRMQRKPKIIENIQVDLTIYDKIKDIHVMSPDDNALEILPTYVPKDQGVVTNFTIPILKIWTTIYIRKL